MGFLFTWKGGKKYVQFFIAIQNWSIKDGKIFTFFKEPVKFPIFFIKFWFRIVHYVWKKCENQICIVHVEYVYQHFLVCYQEFFSWNWPSYFFCDLCTKCITFQYLSNKMKKKKYLRPFQDYMMSVLTYLQSALSNYCIYLVFYFYFLFLTSLSV